ncbi:MAG: S41 family peptidase [Bacteroidia bacterium]
MRKFTLCCLCILAASSLFAQIPQFSQTQAREDLKQVQDAFEKYDPGLYSLLDAPTWNALNDSLRKSIPASGVDGMELYKKLAYLVARCRERHIKIGIEVKSRDEDHWLYSQYQDKHAMFPLIAFVQNDSAWVLANMAQDSSLQVGSRILSINDEPIESVLADIQRYIGMDGINPAGRDFDLTRFWVYYYHWFRPRMKEYEVEVVLQNGKTQTYTLEAAPLDSLGARLARRRKPKPAAPLYSFVYHDSLKLAVVKYASFNQERHKEFGTKPKALFNTMIQTAVNSGAEHLAIDLRSNPGGRTKYMELLLRHLMNDQDGKFVYRKSVNRKGKTSDVKLGKSLGPGFSGEIYILTNPGSFSASSITAGMMKHVENITIIGTETGGRAKEFTAGSHKYVTLEHSELQIGIPLYLFRFPHIQGEGDGGVMPQEYVPYNIEAIIAERDETMMRLFELVKEK